MTAEPIIFGQARTRRLRVDHRPVPDPPPWEPLVHVRSCARCGIPVRFVFRDTLGYGYWQHVPGGREVMP